MYTDFISNSSIIIAMYTLIDFCNNNNNNYCYLF